MSLLPHRHRQLVLAVITASPTRLCVVLACLALVAATEPALAWLIKTVLDWQGAPVAWLHYWMLPFVLLGIFIVRGGSAAGTAHLVGRIGADAVATLQAKLYRQLLGGAASAGEVAPGKLVHLTVFEIKQCADLIERVFTRLVKHIFTIIALYGYLVYLDWQLTFAATLVLPPFAGVCWYLGKRLRLASQRYIAHNEQLADIAIEKSTLSTIVKLHGTRISELNAFSELAVQCRMHALRVYAMAASAAPVTQVLAVLVFSLIVVYLFAEVADGARTKGNAAAFVTNLLLLLTPLKNLAELNGPILRSLTGIGAVLKLLDLPTDRTSGSAIPVPVEGKITFCDVAFTYGGQALRAPTLLDFEIAPGELVALVGASGAGKSTLFKLLCGELTPQRGGIYFDGVPIDQCSLEWIRANIAVVSQDVLVLNRSILENVAYGIDKPDLGQVRAALAAAQLLDHVESLPLGLHTRIGRDGAQLSGGQRQQVALARAYFKNSPILLLDEPTAALDEASEMAVCQALRAVRQGKTTVMITHRHGSVALADRVIFIAEGAVAAYGRHQELVASNACYNALVEAQKLTDRLTRTVGARSCSI